MSNIGVENLPQFLTLSDSGDINQSKSLHPRFIKNAQGMEAIYKYIEKHSDKPLFVDKNSKITLQEHINNHSINMEVAQTVQNENGQPIRTKLIKKVNRSIDEKTLKYLKASLLTLETLHAAGGEKMVEECIAKRCGTQAFSNILYHGLNQEQIDKVKDIYNKEAIKLIIDYNIPREDIERMPVFGDEFALKRLYKIVQNKAKGDVQEAHKIFAQIQNFSPDQLAAIEAGFEIKSVENNDLLKAGNTISATDNVEKIRNEILYMAVKSGDIPVVEELIKLGANINNKLDANDNNALHIAASKGRTEMVNFLLKSDMDIENANKLNKTPLMVASSNWKTDAVNTLLEQGANPNKLDKEFLPPEILGDDKLMRYFKKAIDDKNIKVLKKLSDNYPDFKSNKFKGEILDYAVKNNKLESVALLINEGFQSKSTIFERIPLFKKKNKTPDEIANQMGGEILKKFNELKVGVTDKENKENIMLPRNILPQTPSIDSSKVKSGKNLSL